MNLAVPSSAGRVAVDHAVLPALRCPAHVGALVGRHRLVVRARRSDRAVRARVLHQRRRARPLAQHGPAQRHRDHGVDRPRRPLRRGRGLVRHPVSAQARDDLAARGGRGTPGAALSEEARSAVRRKSRRPDLVRDHIGRLRPRFRVSPSPQRAHPDQHGRLALRRNHAGARWRRRERGWTVAGPHSVGCSCRDRLRDRAHLSIRDVLSATALGIRELPVDDVAPLLVRPPGPADGMRSFQA